MRKPPITAALAPRPPQFPVERHTWHLQGSGVPAIHPGHAQRSRLQPRTWTCPPPMRTPVGEQTGCRGNRYSGDVAHGPLVRARPVIWRVHGSASAIVHVSACAPAPSHLTAMATLGRVGCACASADSACPEHWCAFAEQVVLLLHASLTCVRQARVCC